MTFYTLSYLSLLALCLSVCSCAPYRYPTENFIHLEDCPQKQQALSHWLYDVVPRHRCQLYPYDAGHWLMWAFFGNDDDGIFGEEPTAHFRCEQQPSFSKAAAWAWRNPMHNFCFYVIGSASRQNSELTLLRLTPSYWESCIYRPKATTVFASKGSSFYLALHGGKPFLSTRLVWSSAYETRFYIGWRCRGNFGIRFNLLGRRKVDVHD